MSPRKPRSDIASSEADLVPIARRRLQNDNLVDSLSSDITSGENRQPGDNVLEGSRTPSPQTGWGLLEKFISGNVQIDWRNVWTVLRSISFVAYIVFVCLIMYQDNALGRLESVNGFVQFGYKIGALSLLFLFVLIVTWLLTIRRTDGNLSKVKSKP
jgi:uncharacterized membrane protein (DUF485 family)